MASPPKRAKTEEPPTEVLAANLQQLCTTAGLGPGGYEFMQAHFGDLDGLKLVLNGLEHKFTDFVALLKLGHWTVHMGNFHVLMQMADACKGTPD
tara:strand:+ start:47 stop:331 length:285 start_codon:yes stop_codon:yes gene_type:complete